MSDKLKPCPFCGNEFMTMRKQNSFCYVCCPQCQTEFSCDCTAGRNQNEDATRAAWNRRYEPKELEG